MWNRILPFVALSSLVFVSASARAEDCGVELINALKARYNVSDAASDAGYTRQVLCSKSESGHSSGSSFGFKFPIEGVPFGLDTSSSQARSRRESMCNDETLWHDASRVRDVTQSLLDANGLEAYRICQASPGLECSSYRGSEVDVEFEVSWTPFGTLASVTQTGDVVLNNLSCQFPSMSNGHVFLANVTSQAICEQVDPSRGSSMTIPTDQGDYTCRVAAAPGDSIHDVTLSCAGGNLSSCDGLDARIHEMSYRCEAATRVPVPVDATDQQRANAAQQQAGARRTCMQVQGLAKGLRALVAHGLVSDAQTTAYQLLGSIAQFGLD